MEDKVDIKDLVVGKTSLAEFMMSMKNLRREAVGKEVEVLCLVNHTRSSRPEGNRKRRRSQQGSSLSSLFSCHR